jgi:ubiquinone/menaquinone biosynthesis C-methylase UbiE
MAAVNANPPAQYFTSLSRNYCRQTGNSTRAIFASILGRISPSIASSSAIHDNAGGVGTATSVILEDLAPTSPDDIPEVLITDNNPGMIAAAKEAFRDISSRITATEADSQDLSNISDAVFTHSIVNFSVFLFSDALQALREIHRTLQPDGVAVLLTWKRFGFGSTVHVAQSLVRPDLPPMPIPGSHFMHEGVLRDFVIKAGFNEEKVQVHHDETIRKDEDLEGMRDFMLGDISKMATKDWTDEEKGRWPSAVDEAIQKEVEQYGGIQFEAWTVIAHK